jgi:hypothetical protein
MTIAVICLMESNLKSLAFSVEPGNLLKTGIFHLCFALHLYKIELKYPFLYRARE